MNHNDMIPDPPDTPTLENLMARLISRQRDHISALVVKYESELALLQATVDLFQKESEQRKQRLNQLLVNVQEGKTIIHKAVTQTNIVTKALRNLAGVFELGTDGLVADGESLTRAHREAMELINLIDAAEAVRAEVNDQN